MRVGLTTNRIQFSTHFCHSLFVHNNLLAISYPIT